jgi:GNAT superfamily N-acetyltransferase
MLVRPWAPADVSAFPRLISALDDVHRVAAAHLEEVAPRRTREEIVHLMAEELSRAIADEAWFGFVAEEEGEVLGLAAVGQRAAMKSYRSGEMTADLEVLVVAPEAQRRGIGRALLDAAREEAGRRGFKVLTFGVMSGNAAAEQFYRAAGARHALSVYWLGV